MAPTRSSRTGTSSSSSTPTKAEEGLHRTQRKPSQRLAAAAAAAAAAPPSSSAGRRRREAHPAPPGTRNVTSRHNNLISRAREQFFARERAGAPALRSLPSIPNSPAVEGRELTEAEKLQREVADLMEDIGEDDRDPTYLKFLFTLDETMEEEESGDEDFDGEKEEKEEKEGDEGDNESSDSDSDSDDTDSECDSMEDEDEYGEEEEEKEEEEENADSDEEEDDETSFRGMMRRLVNGEDLEDDQDDYEPGVEELAADSSDEEEEEFVLLEEEENAAAKLAEEKLRKKEDREERDNKTLLRTAEHGACTVCAVDTVVDPVGCVNCANFIGCRKCANRWYRSSKANSDDNIAKCPLCRQFWPAEAADVKEMKDLVTRD